MYVLGGQSTNPKTTKISYDSTSAKHCSHGSTESVSNNDAPTEDPNRRTEMHSGGAGAWAGDGAEDVQLAGWLTRWWRTWRTARRRTRGAPRQAGSSPSPLRRRPPPSRSSSRPLLLPPAGGEPSLPRKMRIRREEATARDEDASGFGFDWETLTYVPL